MAQESSIWKYEYLNGNKTRLPGSINLREFSTDNEISHWKIQPLNQTEYTAEPHASQCKKFVAYWAKRRAEFLFQWPLEGGANNT